MDTELCPHGVDTLTIESSHLRQFWYLEYGLLSNLSHCPSLHKSSFFSWFSLCGGASSPAASITQTSALLYVVLRGMWEDASLAPTLPGPLAFFPVVLIKQIISCTVFLRTTAFYLRPFFFMLPLSQPASLDPQTLKVGLLNERDKSAQVRQNKGNWQNLSNLWAAFKEGCGKWKWERCLSHYGTIPVLWVVLWLVPNTVEKQISKYQNKSFVSLNYTFSHNAVGCLVHCRSSMDFIIDFVTDNWKYRVGFPEQIKIRLYKG